MRLTALCISEDAGDYTGKRGIVKYQQLALLDQDPIAESRLVNTVDYRLRDEEVEKFAGKCMGKMVVLDVKDLVIYNGRLQVKLGKLVEVKGLNGK